MCKIIKVDFNKRKYDLVEIQPLSAIDLVKSIPNIFHAETLTDINDVLKMLWPNTTAAKNERITPTNPYF